MRTVTNLHYIKFNGGKRLEGLDQDWVKLISEAKELGLSIQDVEEFLLNHIKQTAKEISFK